MDILYPAAIFLAAAVVAVPIAKYLGLGAVLGYLIAGIAIGPYGLSLIGDVDHVLHFSEIGVVLLLFVIGLELQPRRLWVMRKPILGKGSAQMMLSALVLALIAYAFALPLATAVIVGLTLALSSTAFALQLLAEKHQLSTQHGRAAFSILLFQDMAVIPMLALIPLMATQSAAGAEQAFSWLGLIKVVAVIGGVVVGGHYLLYAVLRIIAKTEINEVFTAAALLTVIGTALLMEQVGLSMSLGAFLAGVILADSEYRHALEAHIEPFKGLLLGLFFIAVGMSVDIGLVSTQPIKVMLLVGMLLAVKFCVLAAIGLYSGMGLKSALSLAGALPQGGEFAFVIFATAVSASLMTQDLANLLIVVVSVSMALSPLIFVLTEKIKHRLDAADETQEYDAPPDEERPVIIAGFGRVGQIVARVLRAKGIGFTALDISSEHVDMVRRYGQKIYFGDASRLSLLEAAKADRAKVLVLAIGDVEASMRTAQVVRQHFPKLKILARARDRRHAYRLLDLGLKTVWRETFASSLEMTHATLLSLGLSPRESTMAVAAFKHHDIDRLNRFHASHSDEQKMIYLAQEAARELEQIFADETAEEPPDQASA